MLEFLTDKSIIAIAFFVCVGLIVKIFGRKILNAIDLKKHSIINNLECKENQEKDLQEELVYLRDEEKNLKNLAYIKLKDAESERDEFIANVTKKAEQTFKDAELDQEKLNSIKSEKINKNIQYAIFESVVHLLKDTLISSHVRDQIQTELLDKLLDDALGNKI